MAPQRAPYVMRHWRGDLSLGVSYLVNGILLSVIVSGATWLLYRTDIQSTPRSLLALVAGWTLVVVLIGVWQLVGAWRSACRSIRERRLAGRRAIWAQLARAMVALGAVSLAGQLVSTVVPTTYAIVQIVLGVDPIAAHTLSITDDGAALSLAGGIGTGTAAEVGALLQASPGVRRVDLVSNGGRVAEAQAIAALIRAQGLSTRAPGFCASACTIVFMAGATRSLGPAGRLGFHRYAFPGLTAAQETALNDAGKQTLLDRGVSPGFVARAFSTPAAEVWVPDQSTLLDAKVATGLDAGA